MPVAALIAACVALDTVREFCFKKAVIVRTGAMTGIGDVAWYGLGIAIWAVELLIWAAVLSRLSLSIAFPIMSLSYAVTPLAGRWLLGERISGRRWMGIGLITLGAAIIGTTGIE
jgi:drug/metabolite transporter (DMT)-like permease